uniref:F-box domain-containing protein n=1 Tax=Romanomermis culicivorax TaxID=13658 RepID=A0A915HZF4_ROMCU
MDFYKNYCGSIDNINQSGWSLLPGDILTSIFDRLPVKNKYRASMACRSWYQAFKSEHSWRTLCYNERTFTRKKFTMHTGWQRTTDHFRLKIFTSSRAAWIRTLYLQPDTLLFNFYEFLCVLTNFSEFYENVQHNPLEKMKAVFVNWNLKYHKEQHQESLGRFDEAREDKISQMPTLYGTGGRVLNQLDYFLSHLSSLQTLSLNNLLLTDADEIERFMQHLLEYFSDSMKILKIVNLSKKPFPLLHVGFFGNLRRLILTAQHLNDDSLLLLGQCSFLEHLTILQDENTVGNFDIDRKTWLQFYHIKPRVKVHLVCA